MEPHDARLTIPFRMPLGLALLAVGARGTFQGGTLTDFQESLFGPAPRLYHPEPTRVFASGEHGVTCFRIPAVVRTALGTLIAFAESRRGSCHDGAAREIMARRSTDGGATWGDMAVVVGSPTVSVCNPNPIAMSSGRVVLLYANYEFGDNKQDATGISVVTSEDDGASWSTEHRLSVGFGNTAFSLPGPGSGVEISLPVVPSIKRLLAVTHGGGCRTAFILYSDDGAESWHQLDRTFPDTGEGALADLGGGHVLLSLRTVQEKRLGRAFSHSVDGGLTWSAVEYDGSLSGPVCHAAVACVNGAVYFANPASSTAREDLTVRKSNDGGRTWSSQLTLQSDKSFGYSSLVSGAVRDRSHGGLLYEASQLGNIDFAIFPLNLEPRDSAFGFAASGWDNRKLYPALGICIVLPPLVIYATYSWACRQAATTKSTEECGGATFELVAESRNFVEVSF